MKANVGTTERIVRVIVGLVLLSLVFVLESNARWLGLIGIVPLATGAIGWCPAYGVLGIHNRKTGASGGGPRHA